MLDDIHITIKVVQIVAEQMKCEIKFDIGPPAPIYLAGQLVHFLSHIQAESRFSPDSGQKLVRQLGQSEQDNNTITYQVSSCVSLGR